MKETEFRTNLNLLPASYRRRVLVRTGLSFWACLGTVVLAAASVLVWRAEEERVTVQEELSRYQRVYAPTTAMSRELQSMRKRMVELAFEEEAAAELEDDRPTLALLGIVGRAAGACQGRLHVRACELKRAPSANAHAAGQRQLLAIRGAALGVDSIAAFKLMLDDSRMFTRVEFAQDITNEQFGTLIGHVFEIECTF